MSFFLKYLEEKWSIKKRNDVYILKQKDGTRCIYTPSYLAIAVTSLDFNSGFHSDNEIKRTQLLTFLHNALEGGWNIKKQSSMANTSASNTYVFVKKHNGQYKMYEDDEYLTQFMKRNLSLQWSWMINVAKCMHTSPPEHRECIKQTMQFKFNSFVFRIFFSLGIL